MQYRIFIEAALVITAILLILAIPAIPLPVNITSSYTEKVIKSEPYTVVETQQETATRLLTLLDWGNSFNSPFYASLQSYLLISFSLYPAELVKEMSSKSYYTLETAGNTKTEKIKVAAKFDNNSLAGIASDGSICVAKSGQNMKNCRLIATWNASSSYDWNSNSYKYDSRPFVCFHNSPLLIPFSSSSNPATVKLYSYQNPFSGISEGKLILELSSVDASKVWLSARVSPDYGQYYIDLPDLCIDYCWDEDRTVEKTSVKYRETEEQIPKLSSTTDYRKISLWQLMFNK